MAAKNHTYASLFMTDLTGNARYQRGLGTDFSGFKLGTSSTIYTGFIFILVTSQNHYAFTVKTEVNVGRDL